MVNVLGIRPGHLFQPKLWAMLKPRKLDIIGFIQLIVYAFLGKTIRFRFPPSFWWKGFLEMFYLHDAFNFGFRKII